MTPPTPPPRAFPPAAAVQTASRPCQASPPLPPPLGPVPPSLPASPATHYGCRQKPRRYRLGPSH
eukprot:7497604-Pyramimonas_sp.AAC.1